MEGSGIPAAKKEARTPTRVSPRHWHALLKHKAEAAPIRARLRSGRFRIKLPVLGETILRVNALNCQIAWVLCLLSRLFSRNAKSGNSTAAKLPARPASIQHKTHPKTRPTGASGLQRWESPEMEPGRPRPAAVRLEGRARSPSGPGCSIPIPAGWANPPCLPSVSIRVHPWLNRLFDSDPARSTP